MIVDIKKINKVDIPGLLNVLHEIFPRANVQIKNDDLIWICTYGEKIIGFAHFSRTQKGFLLQGIGVVVQYRGKGIGTRILEFALDELSKSDLPIYLKVKSTNEPALSLYLKEGFFQKKMIA
ncbi:GNAT family N-acetyltransferase [Candidatus Micrarchaeota archaeon]|nr:GNAT family N-acetyltransferase [Candidatus Micrarchaeota archaeon]